MNELALQQKTNGLRELALFAGAGGGILGGKMLGWRTVCAVEWDAYAASVLVARQNDKTLDPFPIWSDIQTFDGRPWRGRVDVISGGFPCQDISCAGKGAGIDGERSSMWGHMARIVDEVRPQYVFVENSPMLVGRGLTRVLGDFASLGYDARWGIVGAHHVAAPHKRDRIWIVAHATGAGNRRKLRAIPRTYEEAPKPQEQYKKESIEFHDAGEEPTTLADSEMFYAQGCSEGSRQIKSRRSDKRDGGDENYWATEPKLGRVAHGVANRVDRLKCLGNGQVPHVAAYAWQLLGGPIK